MNARQIAWAEKEGFETISIDTPSLVAPETASREISTAVERALECIDKGANVILHSTSRGPDDPCCAKTISAFRSRGLSDLDVKLQSGRILGPRLGRILRGILDERQFARVGIAGGDTSGYIARELGITALEAIAPVAPGSPLCRAYADNAMDGIEFLFKGGQVGRDDVWGTMLSGTEVRRPATRPEREAVRGNRSTQEL